jgi:hypothetical protein
MPRYLYSGATVSVLLIGLAAFAFFDELTWEIRRLHRHLRMRRRGGMIGNG